MLGSPVDRRVSSIAMKPSAVSGSPVSASQGAAPASVTHSASSKAMRLPSAQISAPGSTRTTSLLGQHRDPALGEDPLEEAADPPVVRRQQRLPGHQRNLDRAAAQGGEPILRRERQLDTGSTAADHREAQPRHLLRPGEQRLPSAGETGDRLDRDRVLGGTGDIVGPRRRADVDRQQVPADRRVGPAQHKMPGPVEADRLVADQPRAGKAREPAEIDVAFLKGVMPGDIAGQHARIGRLDIAADQRDPHPRHRPHAKALQHMDMGMAAADENEILSDRNALLHRLTMPERRAKNEPTVCSPFPDIREKFAPARPNHQTGDKKAFHINELNAIPRVGRQRNSACQTGFGRGIWRRLRANAVSVLSN